MSFHQKISDSQPKAWAAYPHIAQASQLLAGKLYHGLREFRPNTSNGNATASHEHPGQFEFETRFGTIHPKTGKFTTGVTETFFNQSLEMMNECSDWKAVIQSQEVRDYYYYVPAENGQTRYVRTRVEFQSPQQASTVATTSNVAAAAAGSPATQVQPLIKHIVKHKIFSADMEIVNRGDHDKGHAVLPTSVRASLNWEETIPPQLIPKSVTPVHVRIIHPSRFLYVNRKNLQSRPIWSYDFCKVWESPSIDLAEMSMKCCPPTYEIETECLDPIAYMKSTDKGEDYTATSLLLKACDFLEFFEPPLKNYTLHNHSR
jgi:hypothetical protein